MAQGAFTATVSAWVAETKARREAVFKGSAQSVIELMQVPRGAGGNLRVKTGFLRASLVAFTGTSFPVQTRRPSDDISYAYDAGAISLTILGATPGEPITAVYTANYARAREYGANGQAPDRWIALAAQQWPAIVAEECAKAKAQSERA